MSTFKQRRYRGVFVKFNVEFTCQAVNFSMVINVVSKFLKSQRRFDEVPTKGDEKGDKTELHLFPDFTRFISAFAFHISLILCRQQSGYCPVILVPRVRLFNFNLIPLSRYEVKWPLLRVSNTVDVKYVAYERRCMCFLHNSWEI